jgi:hypothetical protein
MFVEWIKVGSDLRREGKARGEARVRGLLEEQRKGGCPKEKEKALPFRICESRRKKENELSRPLEEGKKKGRKRR